MSTLNWDLSKVKVSPFASQETICFEADFLVDGKKVATVRNQGQGGCNYIYLEKGVDKALGSQIDALECEIMSYAEAIGWAKKKQSKELLYLRPETGEVAAWRLPVSITQLKKDYNSGHAQATKWLDKHLAFIHEKGYRLLNTNVAFATK